MDEVTEKTTTVSEEGPAQVVKTTKSVSTPPIKTGHPQEVYDTKKTIFRTYQIIWYVVGVIEALLTFRVLLKILGANAGSAFVSLIYVVSDPLALPFSGIFGITWATEGAYFEWSTLVAMIVYLLIAYALVHLMQIMKPTNPQEVNEKVENV